MKKLMLVAVLLLASFGWPSTAVFPSDIPGGEGSVTDNGTEYWALLVGCNEFINMPSATLPGTSEGITVLEDHPKDASIKTTTHINLFIVIYPLNHKL